MSVERKGTLLAVDGVSGAVVVASAHRLLAASPRRGGVSRWDASGLFEQLMVDGDAAGLPSARTLLLLYAADLAFRLRWEIQPAIARGKTVVAAPYVATAIAVGRAAGLKGGWLRSLFCFAPKALDSTVARGSIRRARKTGDGFVEFACRYLEGRQLGFTARELAERTRVQLDRARRERKSGATAKRGVKVRRR